MFYQDWWLDAVCGADAWDVCLVTQDNNKIIQGALPYFYQSKYGFLLIRMPYLTPYLGPIYNYPTNMEKVASKYAFEKKVTKALLEQLPNYSYFNQHCHSRVTNGQPFHWNKFTQVNQYTYHLDLTAPLDTIRKGYETNVRNEIKRAKQAGLVMKKITSIDTFIEINTKTFGRQGKTMPYTAELVRNLDRALADKNLRTIYGAYDNQGNLHAAVYLLHENGILYTLMIGTDVEYRNSGAVQFLVDGIVEEHSGSDYTNLDFCGSMIENIERVFRSFGAVQKPYLRIYHMRTLLFKIISNLRGKA